MASSITESAIGNGDALALRRAIYGSREPTRADLSDLLSRGPSFGADADFCELIAEVAKDVFIHGVDPEGYVTDADAAWLIQRLGDGGLSCRAEYQILETVISHALSLPAALTEFAVREVEKAILTGRRDAIGGVDHEPGIVTDADVAALRALVFAPTQGSSLHVSRGVAEALFDIAHATATSRNSEEFAPFFARAVGNYLMGVAFLGTPDREEALEVEKASALSFGAFLTSMRSLPSAAQFASALESTTGQEEDAFAEQNRETERRLAAASAIDSDEAKWILAHLSRGGPLTDAERRLIGFIRDEATSAPPEITALYDRAA